MNGVALNSSAAAEPQPRPYLQRRGAATLRDAIVTVSGAVSNVSAAWSRVTGFMEGTNAAVGEFRDNIHACLQAKMSEAAQAIIGAWQGVRTFFRTSGQTWAAGRARR